MSSIFKYATKWIECDSMHSITFLKTSKNQKQSQQSLHLELLFDDQKYMKFIDCSNQVLIKTTIGNEYISTWWICSTCILASVEMLNIKYYVVF